MQNPDADDDVRLAEEAQKEAEEARQRVEGAQKRAERAAQKMEDAIKRAKLAQEQLKKAQAEAEKLKNQNKKDVKNRPPARKTVACGRWFLNFTFRCLFRRSAEQWAKKRAARASARKLLQVPKRVRRRCAFWRW